MAYQSKGAVGIMGPDATRHSARFVPQTTGTYGGAIGATGVVPLLTSYGIRQIDRVATGSYQVTLENKGVEIQDVSVSVVENDTTHIHQVRAESFDSAAGTVMISHKSCVWANGGTGPLSSDVVDQIQVVVTTKDTY